MKTLVAGAAIGLLSACATAQVSPIRLEDVESQIRPAEALGAAKVPTARRHLELARQEQEQARQLANLGDPRAQFVLDKAIADAALAVALAQEAHLIAESLETAHEVESLRGAR